MASEIQRVESPVKQRNIAAVGLIFGIFLGIVSIRVPGAGVPAVAQDDALSREKKEAVVRRVAAEFREKYLFADVAEKMAALIEGKLARGEYDPIASLEPLAARLQEDLRSVSQDKHVKVLPGLVPEFDADAEMLRRENNGFSAVEVLPGNIGYVDFFQFYSVKDAGPTAIAAMNFVAGCDALIVDLRSNGGGYPGLRSLICSYFFAEPTCLIEFRGRQGVTQDWTLPYVPGPRMPKIPIYVLISRFTFSCAEDFSFCLQNLGRATVIGENTRGGAHDAKMWTFPAESISLQIPFNEAVDPRTKKTWEGVGIRPDIAAPASQAFQVAVREAARSLLEKTADGGRKNLLEWIVQDYQAQLEPMTPRPQALRDYAGSYGSFRIALEGDRLYLYSKARPKQGLTPIAPDDFKIVADDRHGFAANRVRFTRNGSGKVTEMFIHNLDGNRFPAQARK
jgi:hypothetical protein